MIKKNSIGIGLIAGLIAPFFGNVIYWRLQFSELTYMEFLHHVIRYKLIPAVGSMSLLPNLAVFFLFLQFHHDNSARGTLIATFVYGLVIVIFKLL